MNNKLSNLTVNILTHRTNTKILTDCVKSISKDVAINIIENSENFENKDIFRKFEQNVSIICTGNNLGYAGGHNYGITNVKTRYVLVLNPDLVCKKDYFLNIQKYLSEEINFHIIGSQYEEHKMDKPAFGIFNNEKYNPNIPVNENNLQSVDWVVGCSMLIDLNKFESRKIFDDNFFLFYEETDLCKRVKLMKGGVYTSKDLIIDHYGEKGSFATEKDTEYSYLKLRNWHLMWSSFYFYKKNFNYFYALKILFGTFVKSFFKIIFFGIIFNKYNYTKHLHRFLGLYNSMIGKKSWFRV